LADKLDISGKVNHLGGLLIKNSTIRGSTVDEGNETEVRAEGIMRKGMGIWANVTGHSSRSNTNPTD
jgi:hypothetical protein